MTHGAHRNFWTIAIAGAVLAAVPAAAQSVAPEPAPTAQQAVPADKVGTPLHAREAPTAQIRRSETTGAAPKELKPSHGDAATPEKLEHTAPSR